MALIKLGTGETQPFKKSGGSIIQPSRGGLTLRNVPKFRGNRTPAEWDLNRFLMYATRHWRAMTATQQNNWHSWATTYPQYIERNPTKPINGYNLFTKINYYRALHQGAAFSFFTEPAPVLYAVDPVAIKIYYSPGSVVMNLNFTRGAGDLVCFIFVSNVASKGLSFGDTRWRFAVSLPSTDANVDLTTFFLQNFARLPEIDQNIFVSVVFIGSNNGQYSFHELAKITVEAPPPPVITVNYGRLYNFLTVQSARNFAPAGWHIADYYLEWNPLRTLLGGQLLAGGPLKSTGTNWWLSPNTGATNAYGFNYRGNGYRAFSGAYAEFRTQGTFWVRVNTPPTSRAYSRAFASSAALDLPSPGTRTGHGIRLVKDSTTLSNGQSGEITLNDGRKQRTICINGREWMADNSVETKFRDGTLIADGSLTATWTAEAQPLFCYPNGNPANE